MLIPVLLSALMKWLFIACYLNLTWLASKSIEAITQDVRSFNSNLDFRVQLRVRQWWRSYSSVQHLVEEVDAYFGPYLLVSITTWFALLPLVFFSEIEIIVKQKRINTPTLFFLLAILIGLQVVIRMTQRLKNQVILQMIN